MLQSICAGLTAEYVQADTGLGSCVCLEVCVTDYCRWAYIVEGPASEGSPVCTSRRGVHADNNALKLHASFFFQLKLSLGCWCP
jgi:hypothetical protein